MCSQTDCERVDRDTPQLIVRDPIRCPLLSELPPAPPGKTGWPWTQESPRLPKEGPNDLRWPKISIVTPSYNQGEYLEEMIRSVLLQGYPNIEFIVVDGGSTDGLLGLIRKYEKYISCWVSEKDRGQSHAINKGLAVCTGEIFNWLNSDDVLCPGAFEAIGRAWINNPGHIIAGVVEDFMADGTRRTFVPKGIVRENFIACYCEGRKVDFVWHQPGIYVPLEAIRSVGGVREEAHFTMDRFLMIDLLMNCKVTYIPEVLAKFRRHNQSKSESSLAHAFGLEFIERIKEMQALPWDISRKKLDSYHVHLLVRGGIAQALLTRNFAYTRRRLSEAFSISRWKTLVELGIVPGAIFKRFCRMLRRRMSH